MHAIIPRKFKLDLSKIDFDRYYRNDRAMTVFWNTLSMMFPEGEKFFVQSVLKYRNDIVEPSLRADVDGFVRQEAQHTKAHLEFNEELRRLGYPVDNVNRVLKKHLTQIKEHAPLLGLHITAILEHYTSVLGIQLLDNELHHESVSDEAKKIWIHHAVEEFEHRAVSFDVLQVVGGKQVDLVRKALFIPVTAGFAAAVLVAYVASLKARRVSVQELVSLVSLIALLAENIPMFADWFREGFHPAEHSSKNVQKVKRQFNFV